MIIMVIAAIVILCLVGAILAFVLTDSEGNGAKWMATEESLPTPRPFSHVAQGPDSLYPLSGGSVVNKPEK